MHDDYGTVGWPTDKADELLTAPLVDEAYRVFSGVGHVMQGAHSEGWAHRLAVASAVDNGRPVVVHFHRHGTRCENARHEVIVPS